MLADTARCEHFRARFDSGMQDANDGELSVPEQFCPDAMASFLHYIYKDELPRKLSAQSVIEVLHVACYYGVPRCECIACVSNAWPFQMLGFMLVRFENQNISR